MDRAIRDEPSASGQPHVPYAGRPDDCGVHPARFAAWADLLDWRIPAALFIAGWILQFIGHAFERKPPQFFKDWRFLFVGLRWWMAKVRGRA